MYMLAGSNSRAQTDRKPVSQIAGTELRDDRRSLPHVVQIEGSMLNRNLEVVAEILKRPYCPPQLSRYGALRDLTQGGSGKNAENNYNKCVAGTANPNRSKIC